MMKMAGVPGSISKLLPADHCWPTDGDRSSYPSCDAKWRDLLLHYHLDGPRNVARFSDAHDAKYGVRAFKHDETLNSINLRCCPSPPRHRRRRRRSSDGSNAKERKSRWLVHLRIVGCPIQCIRPAPRLKEAINKIIWNYKRAQHVARGVRCVDLLTANNDRGEIFVPSR